MILTRRTFTSLVLLITLPALVLAARAWACVPLSVVTVLPNSSGPAGSTVQVKGENFQGPVEVRWNSEEGPLLASVNNPATTTTVKVPAVAPGLYTLIMLSRQPDRTVGAIARAPFYVQGAPRGSDDQSALLLGAAIIALAILAVGGLLLRRRQPVGR